MFKNEEISHYLGKNANPYHCYEGIEEAASFLDAMNSNIYGGNYKSSEITWNGRQSPWHYLKNQTVQIYRNKPNTSRVEYLPIDCESGELKPYYVYKEAKTNKNGKVRQRKKNSPRLVYTDDGTPLWKYECYAPWECQALFPRGKNSLPWS